MNEYRVPRFYGSRCTSDITLRQISHTICQIKILQLQMQQMRGAVIM